MRFFLTLLITIAVLSADAQSSDPSLKERLNRYASLNRELNFRELMEYIHPSLFKIRSKEDMIQVMESGFNNEHIEMKFDSISMQTIGPVFNYEGSQYHKVDYYMALSI